MYKSPGSSSTHPTVKIEAVVTCVQNADFLAHTLPLNRGLFDKIIVVTAPEDKETQRVCNAWHVPFVATDVFRTRWNEFCKGSGINVGLGELDLDAWIVHMDADIVLPPHFRTTLQQADLDTSMIYGVDRYEFKNYAAWMRFLDAPESQQEFVFINTQNCEAKLGTRVSMAHLGGYLPIGFFQLWHADSGVFKYPEGHTDAGREDTLHPARWPRGKRGFLPEIIAYHLESEPAHMSVNWKGRKTKPFRHE